MAVQSVPIGLQPSVASSATWRSRTIAIVLMVVIAGIFWIDSRYPALMKRYNAGTTISAKGSLTFGLVYAVDRSMPLTTRVWRTTVNWLDANRVGMTFSFLFGPAALTFLTMLRRRRTTSVYLNTLFGAAAGAPLAVCTNCIAPIARGFFASGMSPESVLAAMFASPALNVVVLAMTFVLFPVSVGLLKLFTVLFLIFVFVPLVSKRQGASAPIECAIELPVSETWGQAIITTLSSYFKNFWYIA
ncbi:MAG: permease, partial [Acidobacteria bacterium]|nr:permease [Acidobacteriota bacterium]